MKNETATLPALYWIEDLLPANFISKPKHGGLTYYLDDKLILILVESGRSYEHKGISYPFQIWNGCIFPIESIKQGTVFIKFPFLTNHPASAKWLYLPQDSEDFEQQAKLVVREINKKNPLFGIPIKFKATAIEEIIDSRRPKLFSEEPVKKVVKKTAIKKPKSLKKIKADKKPENQLILSVLKRRSR